MSPSRFRPNGASRCGKGSEEIQVILRMEGDIDAFQARDRGVRPWVYLDR